MNHVKLYAKLLIFPLVYVLAFLGEFLQAIVDGFCDGIGEVRWQHHSMLKIWREQRDELKQPPQGGSSDGDHS